MRRALLAVFIALAFASACFAQGARNTPYVHEGKSVFQSIGVHGLNTDGNPGFIEMRSVRHSGAAVEADKDGAQTYYLWIDTTGDLCMASYTTISAFSSFTTGDWTTGMDEACTKVGGQS